MNNLFPHVVDCSSMSSHLRRLFASIAIAGLALAGCGDDPDDPSANDIEGVVVEDGQTNNHVDAPIDYDADPPSGGDHADIWLNCDVYDIPVPEANAVHSLEHGVVWIAYDSALDADDVSTLEALHASEPDRMILSPHEDLPSPVVAVAWERRLEVDSADDPRLADFVDAYVNGAQAPEPGAACAGGLSQQG